MVEIDHGLAGAAGVVHDDQRFPADLRAGSPCQHIRLGHFLQCDDWEVRTSVAQPGLADNADGFAHLRVGQRIHRMACLGAKPCGPGRQRQEDCKRCQVADTHKRSQNPVGQHGESRRRKAMR